MAGLGGWESAVSELMGVGGLGSPASLIYGAQVRARKS